MYKLSYTPDGRPCGIQLTWPNAGEVLSPEDVERLVASLCRALSELELETRVRSQPRRPAAK